jgi:hypothetical protein
VPIRPLLRHKCRERNLNIIAQALHRAKRKDMIWDSLHTSKFRNRRNRQYYVNIYLFTCVSKCFDPFPGSTSGVHEYCPYFLHGVANKYESCTSSGQREVMKRIGLRRSLNLLERQVSSCRAGNATSIWLTQVTSIGRQGLMKQESGLNEVFLTHFPQSHKANTVGISWNRQQPFRPWSLSCYTATAVNITSLINLRTNLHTLCPWSMRNVEDYKFCKLWCRNTATRYVRVYPP